MKYHIQAFYKIVFKVDYFLLVGFNEEKVEINHKTLQTNTDLVEHRGSGVGCVVTGGLRRESHSGKYSRITMIPSSQHWPGELVSSVRHFI